MDSNNKDGGYLLKGEYLKDVKRRLEKYERRLKKMKTEEKESKMRMTKKEALKNAIKIIVKSIISDMRYEDDDKYIEGKTNEILKEVSIRYLIGA